MARTPLQYHWHRRQRLPLHKPEHHREYIGHERELDRRDVPRVREWQPRRVLDLCGYEFE